jgi:hypothetical protein
MIASRRFARSVERSNNSFFAAMGSSFLAATCAAFFARFGVKLLFVKSGPLNRSVY